MIHFKLGAILDHFKNDAHVPVGLVVFLLTSGYHFWTGKDLGPNYTNSIYALYAFLGGHALVQGKWGNGATADPPADPDPKS